MAPHIPKPNPYAQQIETFPHSDCYLCGTTKNIQTIHFGRKGYNPQVLLICPECRKWFGEFLSSDKTSDEKTDY